MKKHIDYYIKKIDTIIEEIKWLPLANFSDDVNKNKKVYNYYTAILNRLEKEKKFWKKRQEEKNEDNGI